MTQLVSAARIGRSLGVHLILATQNLVVSWMIRYGVTADSEYV